MAVRTNTGKVGQELSRESLLSTLQSIEPGLSFAENVEQSNCFVIQNGEILTFNDEIACRIPSPFSGEIKAAIPAKNLLKLLQKLKDDKLNIWFDKSRLNIKGLNKLSYFNLESDIYLQSSELERPTEWSPLPPDLFEAIDVVKKCTTTDELRFHTTCVHIHPNWVEAFDKIQICRWNLTTGVKASTLVRGNSIQKLICSGMSEIAETEGWIHFKNEYNLTISCRKYLDEFPDLTPLLSVENAEQIKLPASLLLGIDCASFFSEKNSEQQELIWIEVQPGKISISGEGVFGGHSERKKIDYQGRKLGFYISPNLLKDAIKRQQDCWVNEERLMVKTPSYTYVTCLKPREDQE